MQRSMTFRDAFYRYASEPQTNEADFYSHHHTQYEALCILRGQGACFIENHSYSFADNTVFIIPPGKYHVLRVPPDLPYERFVFNFAPELFPAVLGGGQIVCKRADDELLGMLARLRSYADRFPAEKFYLLLKGFLTEFLLVLYEDAGRGTLRRESAPPLIRGAMDYVNANLEAPLRIEDIADALYVSKSCLVHAFGRVLGTGVMQYVRIKKMCRARRLLAEGVSAAEAAERLGYKNYSTFLRNYRAEFGENPKNARAGGRQGGPATDG